MILSNFKLTKTTGSGPVNWVFTAEVDVSVTTGSLWWKKTVTTRRVIMRKYAESWMFIDTFTYTPGTQAENLAKGYSLIHGVPC